MTRIFENPMFKLMIDSIMKEKCIICGQHIDYGIQGMLQHMGTAHKQSEDGDTWKMNNVNCSCGGKLEKKKGALVSFTICENGHIQTRNGNYFSWQV